MLARQDRSCHVIQANASCMSQIRELLPVPQSMRGKKLLKAVKRS